MSPSANPDYSGLNKTPSGTNTNPDGSGGDNVSGGDGNKTKPKVNFEGSHNAC